MTNNDRKMCQDYTEVAKVLNAKALQKQEKIKENIKALFLVVIICSLFAIAGSLTYPY